MTDAKSHRLQAQVYANVGRHHRDAAARDPLKRRTHEALAKAAEETAARHRQSAAEAEKQPRDAR